MTWLCFTVTKLKNQTKKVIICTNKLVDVNIYKTWEVVIKETTGVEVGDNAYTLIGKTKMSQIGEGVSLSKDQLVSDALEFEPLKYVTCTIHITNNDDIVQQTDMSSTSVNNVLMGNCYKFAKPITRANLTCKFISISFQFFTNSKIFDEKSYRI